jgi:hypothetical protein
MHCIS